MLTIGNMNNLFAVPEIINSRKIVSSLFRKIESNLQIQHLAPVVGLDTGHPAGDLWQQLSLSDLQTAVNLKQFASRVSSYCSNPGLRKERNRGAEEKRRHSPPLLSTPTFCTLLVAHK